jgi:hypothetical protein
LQKVPFKQKKQWVFSCVVFWTLITNRKIDKKLEF